MKNQRYIVQLRNKQKESVKQIEQKLKIDIISSEKLSAKNKSFNIISNNKGILYKNLDILVVDDLNEKLLLESANNRENPIIHFETDKEFLPAGELELIRQLKLKTKELQKDIGKLEKTVQNSSLTRQSLEKMEWGLVAIDLDNTYFTGKGVDICILDTGFETSHPDFATREIEGKSFIENEPWNDDVNGHGTHCSGIAAGNIRRDTGKRYGIAKEANIKIGKVLSNDGKGTTSSIIDGIDWAITKGYPIISMSFASPVTLNEKPSPLFETIGMKALENNCLMIAAAGNNSHRPSLPEPVSTPANAASIMSVAAINEQMEVANFSNAGLNPTTGGEINVCAPGVNIVSSYVKNSKSDGIYYSLSGTSMATPHVSGLATLYKEQFPEFSAKEIWEKLENNARKIEDSQVRDIGEGLVQAI